MSKQFKPEKLKKLNNPVRLKMIPPDYIWKALAPEAHADMVEIGAGTGLFSRAFQKLSGTGKTLALDISDEMVDWMVENISADYPEIEPMKTDGKNLPLADDSADIVFMITVHHELDDKIGILKEARRILRNTGKIFIVDWNMTNLEHGPDVKIRCNPEDVAEELKETGFIGITIDRSLENVFLITADAG